MNRSKVRLTFAVLVVLVIACTCPVSGLPGVAPKEPVTEEPGLQPPEFPAETSPVPSEVPSSRESGPMGVAVRTGDGLAFYNLEGVLQNSLSLPNSEYVTEGTMILAGGFSDGIPPIIYYSFENHGQLMVKAPASLYPLINLDNMNAIVGAPGKDVFAYSRLDFSGNTEQVPSELYVGSLAAPPSTPVTILRDPDSWTLRVLALDMDGDAPVGVWYTLGAWGIGGDIVFEPRKGLFYYDLGNGTTTEWLDRSASPIALSEDQEWVAYDSAGVNLRNLASGQTVRIPLAPAASELRGAGDAVFSPGGRYVAWREASGWQMAETPDFHSRIRAADLEGNLVLDLQDSAFSGLHSSWTHVRPVAWLDEQTLLVQLGWGGTAVLARLPLSDPTPVFFANGAFVGFTYP